MGFWLMGLSTVLIAADSSPLVEQVEPLFEALGERTPGAVVLVARDGEVLMERSYGSADIESRIPLAINSRFRIGSISKAFTAAAILKLQEDGKISLPDRLSRFIPDWPRGDEITLYHLLTHTSGIHDYTKREEFAANVEQSVTLDRLIEEIKASPPDFDPGTKFLYNNSGYVLLAHVIEQMSGTSYASFLRKTFFEPLGMHDTGVYPVSGELERVAIGYRHENGNHSRATVWHTTKLMGAGSLYSTAHDLFRWNEALFNGRVLSAASLQTAFTVGVLEGDDPTHPEERGYGLGWIIDTLRGQREISHGGEIDGFGSYLLRLPAQHLTVVVLLNCVPQMPSLQQWSLARDLAVRALGDELPAASAPVINQDVPAETLEAVVGRYDMGGMILAVTREDKRVFFEITGRPKTELFPRTDRTFFVNAGEAEATFVRNAQDQVIKVILKQGGARIDAPRLP
jgi:CubicO group peptidase (beta-lactamase class C family)